MRRMATVEERVSDWVTAITSPIHVESRLTLANPGILFLKQIHNPVFVKLPRPQ